MLSFSLFELLRRPLIHIVDIGERNILCLQDVTVLHPMRLPGKIRTEDRPDLAWGLCFRSVILWPCHPVIDVILEVPTMNELLYLVLEGDSLLNRMIDIFMEPAVLILVPLKVVST